MKWARFGSMALLAFGLTACDSLSELTELQVVNENNPERARALQQAGDVESLIASGFNITYNASVTYTGSSLMLSAGADETSCSWGNTGLYMFSIEPREAWPNRHSASYASAVEAAWYDNYEALSSVYDGLKAIEDDPELCDQIDCDRAKAFAKLVQGVALGWIGMQFDSGFVFDESVDLEVDVLELQAYPAVTDAAIGYLQEAISLGTGAGWSLPSGWILGQPLTGPELARYAHSLIARFMTQVARTPAERQAVDWATVISHVDAGITEDLMIDGDGYVQWLNDLHWYGSNPGDNTWARADYKTIGWSELDDPVPGHTEYADWLNTPINDRNEFELHVKDKRIMPDPDSSRVAGLDFRYIGASRFPATRGHYHYSYYANQRYEDFNDSGFQTPTPLVLLESMRLIKAEGLLRQGNLGDAASIINETRVTRGGLTPAAATDGAGLLMDRLIYEQRIENFLECGGCAFFTRRGWGSPAPTGPAHNQGPVEGTQLHFAVPGQELDILQKLWYTYGGVGNEGSSLAAPSAAPGMGSAGGTQAPAKMVYAFNGMDSAQDKLEFIHRRYGKRSGTAMLTRH
jgi:hypothetical protein